MTLDVRVRAPWVLFSHVSDALKSEPPAPMRLEPLVRAFLVGTHQSRVARHIGGEDRGKTAGGSHWSGKPARRKPTCSVFSASARYLGFLAHRLWACHCASELTRGSSLIPSARAALAAPRSPFRPRAPASER